MRARVVTIRISQVPAEITVAPPTTTGGSRPDSAIEIQVQPMASNAR